MNEPRYTIPPNVYSYDRFVGSMCMSNSCYDCCDYYKRNCIVKLTMMRGDI